MFLTNILETLLYDLSAADIATEALLDQVRELPLRVASDYRLIHVGLRKTENAVLHSDVEDANVIWSYYSPIKDFLKYQNERPDTFLSKFPNEDVLCAKDLLAEVCKNHSAKTVEELFPKYGQVA